MVLISNIIRHSFTKKNSLYKLTKTKHELLKMIMVSSDKHYYYQTGGQSNYTPLLILAIYLPMELNLEQSWTLDKIYIFFFPKENASLNTQGRVKSLALCTFSHCPLSSNEFSSHYFEQSWSYAPDHI